jgi:hypothetical protein
LATIGDPINAYDVEKISKQVVDDSVVAVDLGKMKDKWACAFKRVIGPRPEVKCNKQLRSRRRKRRLKKIAWDGESTV